ncbi:MAG: hypothetical protein A2293_05985 [Elusimicrobia bacterium RIFOXYB2_FULL_49_7]|nr:MAG: hypothetical protein A2293_05985 [Elusimicrobia bacterium RIFOXYB2_FULL_49_7]
MKAGFLFLLIALLTTGCSSSLKAVITDVNGLQNELEKVSLVRGNRLDVREGPALRRIPLKKVNLVRIFAEETATFQDQLYYQVEVWFLDGSKIQSYAMPNGLASNSYVRIDNFLSGVNNRIPYRIPLKDIRQIRFIPKE